jgi:hypothetical protein
MKASRFFRFRLRTLLATIAVVSFPLGWYAYNAREVADETRVFEELNRFSPVAIVALRDNDGIPSIPSPGNHIFRRYQGPAWLRGQLECCFGGLLYRAEEVGLQTAHFDDRVVKPLVRLPHLRRIGLGGTLVTQDGLDRLRRALPDAKIER